MITMPVRRLRPAIRMRRDPWLIGIVLIILVGSLGACNFPDPNLLPTPLPSAELPTAIAATMAALRPEPLPTLADPEKQDEANLETIRVTAQSELSQPTATQKPELDPTSTAQQQEETFEAIGMGGEPNQMETSSSTGTPAAITTPTATPTPFPEIPIAGIQIFKPGDLSRVISPIDVSAYLRPGAQGQVTIELFGEDGRLLVRQIRVYDVAPGARVNLAEKVPFQISAAAEVGRLVLSMADDAGRMIALSSVDLILLSMGDSDINPSDLLQELIYIREPKIKTLVQGGTVLVSGLARPFIDQPLVVHLITGQGKVIGQRVVGVGERLANGYGEFAVEVAYTVNQLTPVRLTIYEIGLPVSPIRYLASLELTLGP